MIQFHPAAWGIWGVCVVLASLFGFQTMLAVPLVTFFGLIVYVHSTCNEIEYVLPLEDDEVRTVWNGGVTLICRFGAISGACGIGLHLAYLLAELYLGQGVFVQIMRKLENIYVGVSELGFGIGIGVYGFEDICPRDGGLDTKHMLMRILCAIAVSALCFVIGMLILYWFGLRSVGTERKKPEKADTRESKIKNVISATLIWLVLVLFLMMGFGVMVWRPFLLGSKLGYNFLFLVPMVIILMVLVYREKHRKYELEYTPERTGV